MRQAALDRALACFDDGTFARDLARRVAWRTDSQDPASLPRLRGYLVDEWLPTLERMGFQGAVHDNPVATAFAVTVNVVAGMSG